MTDQKPPNPFREHMKETDRVALMIDGANMYNAARNLGIRINYEQLKKVVQACCNVCEPRFYTTVGGHSPEKTVQHHDFCHRIHSFGYEVIQKASKLRSKRDGTVHMEGNMDAEIAWDARELAPRVNHIVLGSGDGDFRYVISRLHEWKVPVTILSTRSYVAQELLNAAYGFINLQDIAPLIALPAKPRLHAIR